MSEVKVNKISPRTACGTVTLGDSGDTFTIPSGATITNNGTQTGFGRTGTVDWITTPKVTGDSPVTGVSGNGYFLNTTAGTITINLPAGSAGDIISMADYAATWQTNNVTVAPNGADKIGALNEDAVLSTEGQSVTFVYVDSTQGWVNTMDSTSNVRGVPPFIAATGGTPACGTTCGDYKIHTFTGPGTFCVSNAGTPSGSIAVDYLVVAGGGSGAAKGPGDAGGGGGAGGFRASATTFTNSGPSSPLTPTSGPTAVAAIPVAVQGYPIVVGSGGAAGAYNPDTNGGVGSASSFSSIPSAGGGDGLGGGASGTPLTAGGSGGGNDGYPAGGGGITGGAGNTPPTTPPQGNNGGDGFAPSKCGAGGGGGAMAVGVNASSPNLGGNGGAGGGFPGTVYGSNGECSGGTRYFSGGGGGGGFSPAPTSATGGLGGGGTAYSGGPDAKNGTVNTGGAGASVNGPGVASVGGTGGSGIVVIRYKFQ